MKSLYIVSVFLTFVLYSHQDPIESLEDVLVYPMEPAMKKQKRDSEDVTTKKAKFMVFVEDKLIQHTQALEYLVKASATQSELLKDLIENLSNKMDEPKLPEKLEVHRLDNRRSPNEDSDNPLKRLGKSFPTYGILFKDVIMRTLERDDGPTPLVERRINKPESRRSGSRPIIVQSSPNNSPSPWCAVALVCHRTYNPVCGYDDNFGYGKFDDLCHMLQVNCYWKYNFALVPTCRPALSN